MNFRTIGIALTTVALFWGCLHRESHKTSSILDNKTDYQITISYYKNGSLDNQNGVQINANEPKEVLYSAENGKGPGMIYPISLQGGGFDSAVVVFSNSRKSVHYGYNKTGRNNKALTFNSPRNIFHPDSYTEKIILETKSRDEREFKYTFTLEDYANAQ
jgi:hypothetical protein